MRIAGGVIAIVVGVIQTILMAIAVLFTSGMEAVTEAVEAGDAELTPEQQEAMAAASDAVAAVTWVGWVLLIVSIVVVILGIMICASKSSTNGMLVAIIGVVLLILSIIYVGDIFTIILSALVILGGVLGYMGAKQETSAVSP